MKKWALVLDYFTKYEKDKNFDPQVVKVKDLRKIHDYVVEIKAQNG